MVRDRTRLRQRDSDPPKPKPYELTGKYMGVLDKVEPVETHNSNQVVASFDAIHVMFTVPKGETIVVSPLGTVNITCIASKEATT